MKTYFTIEQIKTDHEDAEKFFFTAGAKRYFKSRILSNVYGGRYFITSEKFDYNSSRRYTIRAINENCGIDTIGEFLGYATPSQAKKAIKELCK